MTALSQLLTALEGEGGAVVTAIPESWHQGRTAFGGLSAALCVEAALRAIPDAPPLRSAQFAYIGPAAGRVSASASVLRRGRSATFANVDLSTADGLAMRALLCFGAHRDSHLNHAEMPAPRVKAPDECAPAFSATSGRAPGFMSHFETRIAEPLDAPTPKHARFLWVRHRDEAARAGIVPLIAIGDALPPPAINLFTQPGPISTMTWMTEVLTDEPATTGGWWLCRSVAETAQQGYSSQAMNVWNAAGAPILLGRQNVAIFT